MILHVADPSNPRFEQQMDSVNKLLLEIGLDRIPQLAVFNKVDLVNPLWAKAVVARFNGVACSAINPATFGDLLREIEKRVWMEEDRSELPASGTDSAQEIGVVISSSAEPKLSVYHTYPQ